MLIAGQRLNDSTFGQAPVGTEFPIDMTLIERVDDVPGPGSAICGSNAFFGVINIITKKARALAGIAVGAEVASDRTRKALFIAGKRFENGGEGLFSVSDSNSGGIDRYFPEPDYVRTSAFPNTTRFGHGLVCATATANRGTIAAISARRLKRYWTSAR